MPQRKPPPTLAERTSVAEWLAAGAGLLLTLVVIGYTLWEGFKTEQSLPALTVRKHPAVQAGAGYVLPVTVQNASRETAAEVEIRGVLTTPGGASEERRASFAYVPGQGETQGGLVFQLNPSAGKVDITVEGFAAP